MVALTLDQQLNQLQLSSFSSMKYPPASLLDTTHYVLLVALRYWRHKNRQHRA